MWLQRQIDRIGAQIHLALVSAADPGSGTHYLIAELLDGDTPVLWLDFSDWQGGGPLAVLERLNSESWGLPLRTPVTSFEQALEMLGSFCTETTVPMVALTGAEHVPQLTQQLVAQAGPELRVVVCGSDPLISQLAVRHPKSLHISQHDLRITQAEARGEALGSIPDGDLAAIVQQADGAYETVLREIHRARHLAVPETPGPGLLEGRIAALSLEAHSLFDMFLKFKLWQPALLECVRHCPERLHEVLDQAGEQCLVTGHVRRFWRILMALPAPHRNDENVLYWLATAAAAQAHDSKLHGRILNHLNQHEAPHLRTLAAALDLVPEALQQAQRAAQAHESEISSLFLAQLEAIHANPLTAVTKLHGLRRYFKSAGYEFRRLQTAVTLANSYIVAGAYENACYWARKSLDKCEEYELSLPAIQLCAAGLFAYASLLGGDSDAGQRELNAHTLPQELIGMPLVNVYLQAAADYRQLEGKTADALQLNELLHHTYSTFASGRTACSVVQALISSDRKGDALRLASELRVRSEGGSAVEKHYSQLALGMALAVNGDAAAACKPLARVVAYSSDPETLYAPLLAQAGINLACAQLAAGDKQAATETLEQARPGLCGLAAAGWNLFANGNAMLQQVRELWAGIREPLQVNFLGYEEELKRRNPLNLRSREILLLLTLHPAGLSGDRLAGLLDLDEEKHTGMRTSLSRLRKHYPVLSRPYRLAVQAKADFQLLQDLIQQGRMREAVDLYKSPLLPESEVGFIAELRLSLEESLRQAVLQDGDGEAIFGLACKLESDLQLWEEAAAKLPVNHPSRAIAAALLANLKSNWAA